MRATSRWYRACHTRCGGLEREWAAGQASGWGLRRVLRPLSAAASGRLGCHVPPPGCSTGGNVGAGVGHQVPVPSSGGAAAWRVRLPFRRLRSRTGRAVPARVPVVQRTAHTELAVMRRALAAASPSTCPRRQFCVAASSRSISARTRALVRSLLAASALVSRSFDVPPPVAPAQAKLSASGFKSRTPTFATAPGRTTRLTCLQNAAQRQRGVRCCSLLPRNAAAGTSCLTRRRQETRTTFCTPSRRRLWPPCETRAREPPYAKCVLPSGARRGAWRGGVSHACGRRWCTRTVWRRR